MIVDGIRIAQEIDERVRTAIVRLGRQPVLHIIACAPTRATQRFLELKRARATALGVTLVLNELPAMSSTDDVVAAVVRAAHEGDGVVVQLPFPEHIDIDTVLAAIPRTHDVDAIGHAAEASVARGDSAVLPPVVGAIAEILKRHPYPLVGARVLVVGRGRLVGAPAAVWFAQQGAAVETVDRDTVDVAAYARRADVLVLGAGSPGCITPEMVRAGAVVFDAGSSEDMGRLVGDADPAVAAQAAVFTPVPGGIGPITISVLFANLLTLIEMRRDSS